MRIIKKAFSTILVLALLVCIVAMSSAFAAEGTTISKLTNMSFDYAGEFYNGYAYVTKGDDAGYLDKAGTFHKCYKISDVEIGMAKYGISQCYTSEYNYTMSAEGLYPYYDATSHGWGVKNINTGAIIIPPQYPNPTIYRCGRAVMQESTYRETTLSNGDVEVEANSKYTIFDATGKIVSSGKGRIGAYYVDGLIAIETGVLDRSKDAQNDLFKYVVEAGIFDFNGKKIASYQCATGWVEDGVFIGLEVPYLYNPLDPLNYDQASGVMVLPSINSQDEKTTILSYCNKKGEQLYKVNTKYPLYCFEYFTYQNGFAGFEDKSTGLFGVVDTYGNTVIAANYSDISLCSNGYFWLKDSKTGLYGVKDTKGKTVIPFEYSAAWTPGEQGIGMQKNGKYGLLDYNNNVIVPFQYEAIGYSSNGIVGYKNNGLWGYMLIDGTRLTNAEFESCCTPEEGTLLTRKIISYAGKDEEGNPIPVYEYSFYKINKQIAESKTAVKTPSTVFVNGTKVAFEAYNIDGNNYFKLRDLAKALNGSAKQFEVSWDGSLNAISLTSNKPYTSVGGELLVSGNTSSKTATTTTATVYLDGTKINVTAYNIDGNNYFKLRDVGKTMNFGVTWDGSSNAIRIDSSTVYVEEK